MTYLPSFNDNNCIVVDNLNLGYIRVYETTPYPNSTINYTDYFINSDYITRVGSQNFPQYYYETVNCQPHENFTTDYYYRVDLDKILVIFLILCIFGLFLPIKIFSKFFKRGGL